MGVLALTTKLFLLTDPSTVTGKIATNGLIISFNAKTVFSDSIGVPRGL